MNDTNKWGTRPGKSPCIGRWLTLGTRTIAYIPGDGVAEALAEDLNLVEDVFGPESERDNA